MRLSHQLVSIPSVQSFRKGKLAVHKAAQQLLSSDTRGIVAISHTTCMPPIAWQETKTTKPQLGSDHSK